MPKAIVIGSGMAGMACAVRLAVKGFDVQVFEANSYPGGKLSELTCGSSRFDAGPSLFTMPQYVDELFYLADKNPRDYFSYKRLETICNYFFEDGTEIKAYSEVERFAAEIEDNTTDKRKSVIDFFKKSKTIYNITDHIFLQKSLHRISSYLNLKTFLSILRIRQIDPMKSMAKANADQFSDEKTRRIFNRYATYNGSNPYQAPATLNVIPHLEQNFGAYFPKGGMYSITKAIFQLAKDLGVAFNFNTSVDEIIVDNKYARGVKAGGNNHWADIVISNMDIWFTYKKLLPGISAPVKTEQERSSSALIFYWEVKRIFPKLDLHNIFFSDDYKNEFDEIWKHKAISADPTVYVNISSRQNPTDAPEGSENWFVMINVPSNSGQDWEKFIAEARQNIISKLSRILKTNIAELIACEKTLDPTSIEKKTSSYHGSLYGTSSNGKFAAFLRHANFSSRIKGLYFAGGSVHPGGGIPLALLSAKIVDGLIKK